MDALGEPISTALLLAVVGLLLCLSVLFSRASRRVGLPVPLIFLAIGMLAGEETLGGISFSDYHFTLRLGTIALCLILFDGGLSTPLSSVRRGLAPASVLATIGVLLTAGLVALLAMALGLPRPTALLLGAVV